MYELLGIVKPLFSPCKNRACVFNEVIGVFLLTLFTIVSGSSTIAQNTTLTRDLECWTSVGIRKKLIDNKLTFGLQQQFRFDHDISRLYQYFTNMEANYEVYNNLELGLGYRFIKDGDVEDGFLSEHRINTDVSYGKKIERFRIEGRVRYQYRTNAEHNEYPTKKYRYRIKFNYNIKKWKYDPFLATELFHTKEKNPFNFIDEVSELNTTSGIEKIRLQLGTKIKTGNFGGLKVFYLYEHQFSSYGANYYMPMNWNIIGINYTFTL